jgi:hypothetical protein
LEALVKSNAQKFSVVSAVVMPLAAIVGYLLIGGKDSGAVQADSGVTTEKAAAWASAQVLSTDPKLKVEPK